ncbi:MAG: SDR family oxidoreductase [Verrucomicrobia bacterium]|nr:SDR family oxidoreductase [Verrucomicrobiota bacterium]
MSINLDFSGKVALITGASQGIGAEMARRFHAAGATVVLNHPDVGTARADAEQLAATLNALRPDSASAWAADVSKAGAVQGMMQDLRAKHAGIDFLINNAGILRDHTLAKMTIEDWQAVVDVNLTGVFLCCKFGLEIMRDGGAIVGLGSISAFHGSFGQANYAAAKAGVQAIMRVVSREAAKRGIRANAIAPGVIATAMTATIPENIRMEMVKNIPLGRLGSPSEVADVALFLCSPLASYVSGQTIEVNGGWRG